MGYYTESHFKFTLKEDTPKEIIDILDKVINGDMSFYASLLPEGDRTREAIEASITNNTGLMLSVADTPNLPIKHPFGKCKRWDQFLNGTFDVRTRRLVIDSDIKAYDQEEYLFLGWLAPYIIKSRRKKGTYLGWHKVEEAMEQAHHYLETVLEDKFKWYNQEEIT